MIFRFAFARHHTDIVTADQRIQPGNAGREAFGVTSQNWVSLRSASFISLFHAGGNFNLEVLTQRDILYRTNLYP